MRVEINTIQKTITLDNPTKKDIYRLVQYMKEVDPDWDKYTFHKHYIQEPTSSGTWNWPNTITAPYYQGGYTVSGTSGIRPTITSTTIGPRIHSGNV